MGDTEDRVKKIMELRIKEEQKKAAVEYNINTDQYIGNAVVTSAKVSTEAIKGSIHGASVYSSREKWLEDTQHMRVVALNEACEIAKAHISCGESMAATEITSMASLFAKFLVNNEA
jgi:hypothetical protein